jgi:hypothetical protein
MSIPGISLVCLAATVKEPLALMAFGPALLLWRQRRESRLLRNMAVACCVVSGTLVAAALSISRLNAASYGQQGFHTPLFGKLAAWARVAGTGMFIPLLLGAVALMALESVRAARRHSEPVSVAAGPVLMCLVCVAAGWGHLVIAPQQQTRYLILGLIPTTWLAGLAVHAVRNRKLSAGRISIALVFCHWAVFGTLSSPQVNEVALEWRATEAMALLPPGTAIGLLENDDNDRPSAMRYFSRRILQKEVNAGAYGARSDVVVITSRSSPEQARWWRECAGGAPLFVGSVSGLAWTLGAALGRSQPVEFSGMVAMRRVNRPLRPGCAEPE